MKTIGLIGGMSWESSNEYYRIINETVQARLGGHHSAKLIMISVDFAEIEILMNQGRWDVIQTILVNAAKSLEIQGAAFILLCTNTMHKVADAIQASINIPLFHIADAAAQSVKAKGLNKIGLLGTRFTMEEDFYRGRLNHIHNLNVLVPEAADRILINKVIFEELVIGKTLPTSKDIYLRVINELISGGAQGIILGCTEIGLLIKQEDSVVPLFDTTFIHATSAVDLAVTEE